MKKILVILWFCLALYFGFGIAIFFIEIANGGPWYMTEYAFDRNTVMQPFPFLDTYGKRRIVGQEQYIFIIKDESGTVINLTPVWGFPGQDKTLVRHTDGQGNIYYTHNQNLPFKYQLADTVFYPFILASRSIVIARNIDVNTN